MLKRAIVEELWSACSITSVEASPIFIKASWSEIEEPRAPGMLIVPERWLECVFIDRDGIRAKSWFGKGNPDIVMPVTDKLADLALSEHLKMPVESIKRVFFPSFSGHYSVVALLVFHNLTDRYREAMPGFRNPTINMFMEEVRLILVENVWEHFDPQNRYYQPDAEFS